MAFGFDFGADSIDPFEERLLWDDSVNVFFIFEAGFAFGFSPAFAVVSELDVAPDDADFCGVTFFLLEIFFVAGFSEIESLSSGGIGGRGGGWPGRGGA